MRLAAAIVAGGRGKRLAAPVPKALVQLGGRALIEHVLQRLGPPVEVVVVNANEPDGFAMLGLPVVPDRVPGFEGPLAGLDAASAWLRVHRPETTHLLSVPSDTPFLPEDLVDRLVAGAAAKPRLAVFAERPQPTVALWPLALLDILPAYLSTTADRSIIGFAKGVGFEGVAFPPAHEPGGDPFFNINTADDLQAAGRWLEIASAAGKPF